MSLLVVSATAEEAVYVRSGVEVLITGVGKTSAATAVAARLAAGDVTTVVNIGSCGALRPGLSGVFVPGLAWNHDLSADALRSFGYDPRERLTIPGGDGIVLATGDLFVSDPAVRDRLAESADLVDMEGYAVVYAAQRAGVGVRLVKHVSDQADTDSMAWPDLVDASARALGEWLDRELDIPDALNSTPD